jgi:site-specific DNA-cytosine methylase
MAIKILIGGSPCTHWSIAQKNNRETTAEGIGWELFKNYLIAKEKFKPDLFLYENNKSAAQAIKDQIAFELGVGTDPKARFTYINSALVSAQNRQRFYVTNFGDIEQPEDRGILLKDILETGTDLTQNEKSYCMTASYDGAVSWNTLERSQRSMVAEPVRVGDLPNEKGEISGSQATRIYDINGKSINLVANGGGQGAKTGLYAIPVEFEDGIPVKAISCADGKEYPVYQVLNGQITIKNKQYPIKLQDGYYIIRKLTVIECCRLQTMPDDYCKAVSATQGYKGLGNGWTAEVIIHLLNHALKDVPRNEEIIVLSLYDGIGTGRYCLEKMGFTNVTYHAYEIDKYPIQIAMDNYPNIIQHGDAFAVREDDWQPPQTHSEWLDESLIARINKHRGNIG